MRPTKFGNEERKEAVIGGQCEGVFQERRRGSIISRAIIVGGV